MPRNRRSLVALAVLAAMGSAWGAGVGPASAAVGPALTVAPNPVKLGQPITVSIASVKPGELLIFQAAPLSNGGFGGGNMGTHRAGHFGLISFRYPAFTAKWEIGRWRITAYAAHGVRVASAVVTVLAR